MLILYYIEIVVSIIGCCFCFYALYFWWKNKDSMRFFVSLKDILSQIDNKKWESKVGKGKENCKDSIISAVSYGIKESKSNIKKVLNNLNDSAELEARRMLSSHDFVILILIFLSISIIRLASIFGFELASITILGFNFNIINKMLVTLGSMVFSFSFMAYLYPKIKEMKNIFGQK